MHLTMLKKMQQQSKDKQIHYSKATVSDSREKNSIFNKVFSKDLSAIVISNIKDDSSPAINRIFMKIRKLFSEYCEINSKLAVR